MMLALLLAAAVAGWVLWVNSHPMGKNHPRFKFNSPIPKLLGTGAVCVLGWCFVRGNHIGAHHRAHETWHHLEAVRLGRWRHLWRYLWALAVLAWRSRLSKVEGPNGRIYLAAYFDHPEERAARKYADANHGQYVPLGVPR
jgi:hypothetical protein